MRARALLPALVLVIGWAGFMVYAYPGFMSFDSGWQLLEARSGHFTDWHPPVMAELWRVVNQVIVGPLGMLLIQSIAFTAGLYLILTTRLSRLLAAVITIGLLWFPPIGTTLAVIWKDSQMAAFLTLGVGLMLRPGLRWQLGGLLGLVLASGMRHNAFTMTATLVLLLCTVGRSGGGGKRYAIAGVMWLAITVCGFGANAALTDEQKHPWHGSLAMFDIVGTIRFASDPTDDALREDLRGTPIADASDIRRKAKAAYDPFGGVFAIMEHHFLEQPTNQSERDAIAHAWVALVTSHRLAYLRHRWNAYRELLQLTSRQQSWIWTTFDPIGGYTYEPTATQAWLQDQISALGTAWFMRPFVYLLLALLLLPWAAHLRDRTGLALLLSGVMSEAALFFLAPTPDFRYSIWLVITVPLGAVLMAARALHLRRARRTPPAPAPHRSAPASGTAG